jgi:glycosyltransferase involved in cell wall biosynthesis
MKLTIGMPCHYDYSGVIFTIKSLLDKLEKEWPNHKDEVEIIVVDNTSGKQYREITEREVLTFSKNIRYLPFLTQRGPAEVKNRVMQNAKGEYTLCLDCHVILKDGALSKLREFLFNLNEKDSLDYYTGPLENNAGALFTHFDPIWRNQMWGTWASDKEIINATEPKPIWGQGCGLFLVKTVDWLGFNKHFAHFGAEEGYIHEKYRSFGRQVKCLPWLIWWHRFYNPDAKQSSLSIFGKVRNYAIGFQEIGLPLEPIYKHFVSLEFSETDIKQHMLREHGASESTLANLTEKQIHQMHRYHHKISEYNWKRLVEDPISFDSPLDEHLEHAYREYSEQPDNKLKEFMPVIRKYSEGCLQVAEISRDPCTGVSIVQDNPKKTWNCIYSAQPHPSLQKTAMTMRNFADAVNMLEASRDFNPDTLYIRFPEAKESTDINTVDVLARLARRVSKYILLADSGFKNNIQAMQRLCATGEWHPIEHHMKFTGFTVLGREKPEVPVHAWPPGYGPGTELKKLLGKVGIKATANCSCNARAVTMDWHGIEWCENNKDLISSWLKEEANKRGLPYVDFAGKSIINMAIKKAKKNEKNIIR